MINKPSHKDGEVINIDPHMLANLCKVASRMQDIYCDLCDRFGVVHLDVSVECWFRARGIGSVVVIGLEVVSGALGIVLSIAGQLDSTTLIHFTEIIVYEYF